MPRRLSAPLEVAEVTSTLLSNIARYDPRGRHIQIGRTLIAVSELLTLTLTSWSNLTATVLNIPRDSYCTGPQAFSVFCLGGRTVTPTGLWVAIAILALVVSGLLPRIVAPLHIWVALSMNVSLSLPDGGESVASFTTIFIAVIVVADGRICAWFRPRKPARPVLHGIAYAAALGLCAQMAGVYFTSGLTKLAVPEWQDGTAMYYIVRDPYFGATSLAGTLLEPISDTALGTAALSWGTIVLECAIATFYISSWRWKRYALALVIVLHLGIAVALGLWSFSLIMIGAAATAVYALAPVRLRPDAPVPTASAEQAAPSSATLIR